MIPSTKVILKNKTKVINQSNKLQKLTLVLLMFMATGCMSVDEQRSCTDVRVVPAPEFKCTYTNPWHMVCARKRVYKTVCAN